ncbi:MAG: hypothetical protein M3437_11810, partial [Chloroflexota bacterium]|nr:hypothetical protein [Chloroflexota bacterium]
MKSDLEKGSGVVDLLRGLGLEGATMLVTAASAIAIGLLDFVGFVVLSDRELIRMSLVGVGIMMFALVAQTTRRTMETRNLMAELRLEEMIEQHAKLDEGLSGIRQVLASKLDARKLLDEKSLYEEAQRLVQTVSNTDTIRATSLSIDVSSASVRSTYNVAFLKAAALRIRQARELGGTLTYRVVIGYEHTAGKEPSANMKAYQQTRRKIFSDQRASNGLDARCVDAVWPLEFFLVADSIIISFVRLKGESAIQMGMLITDKELARIASEWYD